MRMLEGGGCKEERRAREENYKEERSYVCECMCPLVLCRQGFIYVCKCVFVYLCVCVRVRFGMHACVLRCAREPVLPVKANNECNCDARVRHW